MWKSASGNIRCLPMMPFNYLSAMTTFYYLHKLTVVEHALVRGNEKKNERKIRLFFNVLKMCLPNAIGFPFSQINIISMGTCFVAFSSISSNVIVCCDFVIYIKLSWILYEPTSIRSANCIQTISTKSIGLCVFICRLRYLVYSSFHRLMQTQNLCSCHSSHRLNRLIVNRKKNASPFCLTSKLHWDFYSHIHKMCNVYSVQCTYIKISLCTHYNI